MTMSEDGRGWTRDRSVGRSKEWGQDMRHNAALSTRPHPATSPQHHVQDPATTNPPRHNVQDPTANLPPRHLNTVHNAPPPPTPTPPPIHRHAAPTQCVGLCHRLLATLPHPDTDSRPHHRPPATLPQPGTQDPAVANQSSHCLNTDANPVTTDPPRHHNTARKTPPSPP
ncbi:hypothetical protein EDB89DRAFT_1901951 [Lactarius sanguifluus]|nr:hypothetical protein EDB89DRAFT_1901951 [Lactarius sanguifluus]